MRDLNKVIVSGRAVKDAELKEANGLKIATFTLACNYDNSASYFPVTCYGGLAENVAEPYITKGKELHIEGRLKQERFQTKEGRNCSKLSIVAQKILLKGGNQKCQPRNAQNAATT